MTTALVAGGLCGGGLAALLILLRRSHSLKNQSYYDPNDGHADWLRQFESTKEMSYWAELESGELPPALCGTFLRNGPGCFEAASSCTKVHLVDTDGMIVAISIADGQVFFSSRFVQTEGYQREQAAQRILYRGIFGTLIPGAWWLQRVWRNVLNMGFKNTANTNLLAWPLTSRGPSTSAAPAPSRIFAFWEGGHPHALTADARLDTLGPFDFGGALRAGDCFSAHPRCDVAGGRLFNFGVDSMKAQVSCWEFDVALKLVRKHLIKLAHATVSMHSFAVTKNHIVLVQCPINFNAPAFLCAYGIDDVQSADLKRPTLFYVIPRNPDHSQPINGEFRLFTAPGFWSNHHVNAFEDADGCIVLDSIVYNSVPKLNMARSAYTNELGRFVRFTIDLAPNVKEVTRAVLFSGGCEMPTINRRFETRTHRFVYMVRTANTAGKEPWTALIKLDTSTGTPAKWSCPDARQFVGQPAFAPDPARSDAEDGGWLLCLLFDAAALPRPRSRLLVFDAQRLQDGPLATVALKQHVPFSIHTTWHEEPLHVHTPAP